jgi:plastocyanin
MKIVYPVLAGLLLSTGAASAQSLSYTRGQNVSPAYEGWEQDADGTKHFVFGYMNRNWQEEIDVPVGPENGFNVGGADQGQPTHFLPRRNRFVFRVPVPAGFNETDELVWTLTTKGKTERAYASLRLDYRLDDVVRASETGALGAGSSSPEIRGNRPPKLEVQGRKSLTARVGEPVMLSAVVTDDGIPKRRASGLAGAAVSNVGSRRENAAATTSEANPLRPNRAMQPPARVTVGKNVGLHVTWYVYRGKGNVTFSPDQVMAWEDTRAGANSPWAPIWAPPEWAADGKAWVTVTFHDPGTYVIRSHADDGALMADGQVTVVVTP